MRAASSDLVDVSSVPPGEIMTRREKIKVRWWFDREVSIRETKWGPVLSDAPLLKREDGPEFSLRWAGHQVSDEVGAMMKVSKARNFQEFRAAFKTFSVSGQNMLYADVDGNIGQVAAVKLPTRSNDLPADVLVSPAQSDVAWGKNDGCFVSAGNGQSGRRVPALGE